jgi:predicted peptidase
MLFLHGAGERGEDLEKVKVHGPPKLIEQGKDFPFIVISPQCPEDQWWSITDLDVLLDEIIGEYKVDTDRIYVTGLSMGGFATWDLAIKYPNRFAAIAPVCGGGNSRLVSTLKELPVWVFHGAKDNVVPLKSSQEMVDALEKADGEVKFTIYPEATHDSWTETYNNPELYEWFLQKRKVQ